MTLMLSIHPVAQFGAILIGFYGAYLGFQRIRSMHFGKVTMFLRERHAIAGTVALVSMLGGIAAGFFMVNRYLLSPEMGLHVAVAMTILPLGVFGIFSGFFLYFKPKKRKSLPVLHGITNLVILALALAQIVTGITAYLHYVLRW